MKQPNASEQSPWDFATFEGAELSVLSEGLKTSFREKLEWLEEAETLALKMQEQREKKKVDGC